jgi:hypothetical protein
MKGKYWLSPKQLDMLTFYLNTGEFKMMSELLYSIQSNQFISGKTLEEENV